MSSFVSIVRFQHSILTTNTSNQHKKSILIHQCRQLTQSININNQQLYHFENKNTLNELILIIKYLCIQIKQIK